MIKVGITGGIGSGKTTICQIFEVLGVPVYYADVRAKALMEEDPQLIQQLKLIFGEEIYVERKLQRKLLADQVFIDKEKLAKLNAAVHPAVFRDVEQWMQQYKHEKYVLKEAALIFESGSYKELNKIITVFSKKNIRLQRITSRDQATAEMVEARMANQLPEEEKVKRSDFVIFNNEHDLLIPQVLKIHHQLLTL